MKRYARTSRIATLLQQLIAEGLREHFFDGLGEYITITRVDPSRDLSVAKVYYLTHGNIDQGALEEPLQDVARQLRMQAGKQLRLRRVPEFRFIYDSAMDLGIDLSMKLGDEHGDS